MGHGVWCNSAKQNGQSIRTIRDDECTFLEASSHGIHQKRLIGIIFFYISPLIASIAIVPVPIIFFIGVSFQKKLSPRYKIIREKVFNA